MAFKRKYKFNIIDYLYYAGRIRRIHKWHMPLETIFFAIFGYIPPFLIMRFLAQIKPRFAFGFPFENGKAKVTDKGKMKKVPGSGGEYHYWESDEWYYIDKKGNKTE